MLAAVEFSLTFDYFPRRSSRTPRAGWRRGCRWRDEREVAEFSPDELELIEDVGEADGI